MTAAGRENRLDGSLLLSCRVCAELDASKKTNHIKIDWSHHFIVRQPVDKMLHMALLVFN